MVEIKGYPTLFGYLKLFTHKNLFIIPKKLKKWNFSDFKKIPFLKSLWGNKLFSKKPKTNQKTQTKIKPTN